MPRERKHKRRSGGGRFWGLYMFFTALLIAAVVIGGSIVFFKVNNFDLRLKTKAGNVVCLEGNSRYTEQDIIEASGVHYQDNLCLVKRTGVANSLLSHLSYVSGVSVTRRLPGTLVITITESEAAAAVDSGGKWYAIDTNGKILEECDTAPEIAQITGLTLKDPRVGEVIRAYDGTEKEHKDSSQTIQAKSLLELLPALEGRSLLQDITEIKLSSESVLVLTYQQRLDVKIPLESDFEYQIKLFNSILEDYITVNWSDSDSGTLDMTYNDGQTHLIRDDE